MYQLTLLHAWRSFSSSHSSPLWASVCSLESFHVPSHNKWPGLAVKMRKIQTETHRIFSLSLSLFMWKNFRKKRYKKRTGQSTVIQVGGGKWTYVHHRPESPHIHAETLWPPVHCPCSRQLFIAPPPALLMARKIAYKLCACANNRPRFVAAKGSREIEQRALAWRRSWWRTAVTQRALSSWSGDSCWMKMKYWCGTLKVWDS